MTSQALSLWDTLPLQDASHETQHLVPPSQKCHHQFAAASGINWEDCSLTNPTDAELKCRAVDDTCTLQSHLLEGNCLTNIQVFCCLRIASGIKSATCVHLNHSVWTMSSWLQFIWIHWFNPNFTPDLTSMFSLSSILSLQVLINYHLSFIYEDIWRLLCVWKATGCQGCSSTLT